MKRRDSLKYLLVGTISGATAGSLSSCDNQNDTTDVEGIPQNDDLYGRTPEEKLHDERVREAVYLNEHELETIAVLCDIILPATDTAGSATDAEVPEFIEFIVKDLPYHQLPMRGGLMWLDIESNRRFNKEFIAASPEQQIQIVDDIAYPDPDGKKPEMAPGIKFFNLMRNLTLTGYYTTQMGFKDLGYTGNYPNVWDGVPAEVLANYDVDYEEEWLAKCVDQSKREVVAEWDDKGNLLT